MIRVWLLRVRKVQSSQFKIESIRVGCALRTKIHHDLIEWCAVRTLHNFISEKIRGRLSS
jgi:hypothetical protein